MYKSRIIEKRLDSLSAGIQAIELAGPKAVGKTETASRYANTVYTLDLVEDLEALKSNPHVISEVKQPVLIDEWQYFPEIRNYVKHAVDQNPDSRFLLAGSSPPEDSRLHTGAGRIIRHRMRPMSLAERNPELVRVSLSELFDAKIAPFNLEIDRNHHQLEIFRSGFPALYNSSEGDRDQQLQNYVTLIVQKELREYGMLIRKPQLLLSWIQALAFASSTTISRTKLLARVFTGDQPDSRTVGAYTEALTGLFITDDLDPATGFGLNLPALSSSAKRYLADPALAASLLAINQNSIIEKPKWRIFNENVASVNGRLFESLANLCLKVYSEAEGWTIEHLRTRSGDHEIDFLITNNSGKMLAIEVKTSQSIGDEDVKHLLWLRKHLGDRVSLAVITAGNHGYTREDGIHVVPLASIGI